MNITSNETKNFYNIETIYKIYSSSELWDYWPIEINTLESLLFKENEDVLLTLFIEKDVGFAVLKTKDDEASLSIVTVVEGNQRSGIGSLLMDQIFEYCKKLGVKNLYFGHKVGEYLWPGLPFEPDSLAFFQKFGFKDYLGYPAEDLSLEITNFQPNQNIFKRVEEKGYKITAPDTSDITDLLEFENTHFPEWYQYFKEPLENGEFDKLLITKNSKGEIVASTNLFWGNYKFGRLFDGLVGGGGALGVAKNYRGEGIGIALKAKGTEILREKGIKYVVVQYTSEPDFYKKLGFETFRRYHMIRKDFVL